MVGELMSVYTKAIGKGNHDSLAQVDMKKTRIWMKLDHCFCDDDPYGNVCEFCAYERGIKYVGYTDEEVLKIISGGKNG